MLATAAAATLIQTVTPVTVGVMLMKRLHNIWNRGILLAVMSALNVSRWVIIINIMVNNNPHNQESVYSTAVVNIPVFKTMKWY